MTLMLTVDTALSTDGAFPARVGDYVVHYGQGRRVLVSARYTEAVDVAQAVELARGVWCELTRHEGALPAVCVDRCHAVGPDGVRFVTDTGYSETNPDLGPVNGEE